MWWLEAEMMLIGVDSSILDDSDLNLIYAKSWMEKK